MGRVGPEVPRLLINLEPVGHAWVPLTPDRVVAGHCDGFAWDDPLNYRDVAMLGLCDVKVRELAELAELAGWSEAFEAHLAHGVAELWERYGLDAQGKVPAPPEPTQAEPASKSRESKP